MKKSSRAGGIGQLRLGKLEIARIGVESDQQTGRAEKAGDCRGMTGATESTVNDPSAWRRCEAVKDFGEQDRFVTGGWDLHGRQYPAKSWGALRLVGDRQILRGIWR